MVVSVTPPKEIVPEDGTVGARSAIDEVPKQLVVTVIAPDVVVPAPQCVVAGAAEEKVAVDEVISVAVGACPSWARDINVVG